jgi:hypothetical protein
MTMGGKYKQEVNTNPAPGAYEPERADSLTKFRNRAATIREDSIPKKSRLDSKPDENPSPGQYDGHLTPFGSNVKSFKIGEKRESKIDRSPGPGDFDTDASFNLTKGSIKGGPYIASDNDFEGRNSFMNASLDKVSRYSNKYLYKNMSPNTREKVKNINNNSFTVNSKNI